MGSSPQSPALAWLTAARDPAIIAQLDAIYTMIAEQIEARGPACWASGRCCNFTKTGHLLYVTGLEAAYTIARLPSPPTAATITAARARGDCPFQSLNLCGIHPLRPMGCRVYFCDRSAQSWQNDLSEAALHHIRALHDQHHLEYRYGEWRTMLELFTAHP